MLRKVFVAFMLMASSYAFSQFSLQGTIRDENNEPLVGANVVVKETGNGSVSNAQGNYKLTGISEGQYTIQVSFIGYKKAEKSITVNSNQELDFRLNPSPILGEEVIIRATRAGDKTPVAYSSISEEEIEGKNLGQDIPILLSNSVSVVTSSDAGTGIGYTGLRIRGTDANRINITVNGIPLNDAESHGVFWVNMPDFASSLESVQIQRGVGTSTNGAAAFGATINMQTNQLNKDAYGTVSSSAGSFNTFKNTVSAGTGLLNEHFAFDARLSKITSDGFIDRASSDLKSFFVSGGYYGKNSLLKFNVFSGKEHTYQAWWGVPKVRLENDLEGMQRYEDHWLYTPEETAHMIASDSRTYNYYTYDNETDNYQQDHYQAFFAHQFSENLDVNIALHYTYGRGYYEQYRWDDDLADYNIDNLIIGSDTVTTSDLVRQKWLDNDFYGATFSLNYSLSRIDFNIGGAWNRYDGRHFGNIIWGEILGDIEKDYEWYRNTGIKTDYNIYAKANYQLLEKLYVFTDLQYREVVHDIEGLDDDYRDLTQEHTFQFFNPKAGFRFIQNEHLEGYVYYGIGHREPNRSNFTDANPGNVPEAEQLQDLEIGYSYRSNKLYSGFNLYYMSYQDQLILTGEINDVGSAIMVNVDESYRRGVEVFATWMPVEMLTLDANLTLSQNKILNFSEYVDNWDAGGQDSIFYKETNLSFSPPVIAHASVEVEPVKNLKLAFVNNYVGRQYIDNSSSKERSLDPYLVSDLRITYTILPRFMKALYLQFMVNNLFSTQYENNAWVYSYILGGERFAMDGYFPQAGIHFLGGVNLRF